MNDKETPNLQKYFKFFPKLESINEKLNFVKLTSKEIIEISQFAKKGNDETGVDFCNNFQNYALVFWYDSRFKKYNNDNKTYDGYVSSYKYEDFSKYLFTRNKEKSKIHKFKYFQFVIEKDLKNSYLAYQTFSDKIEIYWCDHKFCKNYVEIMKKEMDHYFRKMKNQEKYLHYWWTKCNELLNSLSDKSTHENQW